MRGPFEEPGNDDHVATNALQSKHPGAIGFDVIEVWHDGYIDTWLKQQTGNNVFFEFSLGRVLAGALRDDD